MSNFSKIEYVDAFYISEDTLEKVDLYPHTAYGTIMVDNPEYIILSFVNSLEDKNVSEKGLLLIKKSLVSNYTKQTTVVKDFAIGDKVNVYWDDIVYFEKSIPKQQTKMYTEGHIVALTKTFLIIKDPVTLRIFPKPIKNHPGYTPFYYVIPLSFITKIEK